MNKFKRRFLFMNMPDKVFIGKIEDAEDRYLCDGDSEFRLRKISEIDDTMDEHDVGEVEYTLSVEYENERKISREEYEELIDVYGVGVSCLNKRRYELIYNGREYSLSVYADKNISDIVEITFDSVEAAESLEVEDWMGREVTDDKNYKNYYLWKMVNSKVVEFKR